MRRKIRLSTDIVFFRTPHLPFRIHLHLPSGDDFTNLHQRLGEAGYLNVLHGLVEIASGLVTGRIRTHDGTLFETRANYRGCAYFCDACQSISVQKLVTRVKLQVQHIIKNQATRLGKEKRMSIEPQLGLELPIACSTGPASLFEGHLLPINTDQIKRLHPQLKPKLDIADCGYDGIKCYQHIRHLC